MDEANQRERDSGSIYAFLDRNERCFVGSERFDPLHALMNE